MKKISSFIVFFSISLSNNSFGYNKFNFGFSFGTHSISVTENLSSFIGKNEKVKSQILPHLSEALLDDYKFDRNLSTRFSRRDKDFPNNDPQYYMKEYSDDKAIQKANISVLNPEHRRGIFLFTHYWGDWTRPYWYFSMHCGGFFRYNFHKYIAAQLGVYYRNQGCHFVYPRNGEFRISLDYLEIPLTSHFYITFGKKNRWKFDFYIGPKINFLLSSKGIFNYYSQSKKEECYQKINIDHIFKKYEIGLLGGIGLYTPWYIFIYLQSGMGLTGIVKNNPKAYRPTYNINIFQVGLGLDFGSLIKLNKGPKKYPIGY